MNIHTIAFSLTLGLSLAACGEEDDHAHDAEEFQDRAECEAHYEEEGLDADEIAELCADVAE